MIDKIKVIASFYVFCIQMSCQSLNSELKLTEDECGHKDWSIVSSASCSVKYGGVLKVSLQTNSPVDQVEYHSVKELIHSKVFIVKKRHVQSGERYVVKDGYFFLYNMTMEDEGTYVGWGKSSLLFTLNITVTAHEQTLILQHGDNLTISIDFWKSMMTVLFFHGRLNSFIKLFPAIDNGSLSSYEGRLSLQNGLLIIRNVTEEDAGNYTVKDQAANIVSVYSVIIKESSTQSISYTSYRYFLIIPIMSWFVVIIFCVSIYYKSLQHRDTPL
ncbi:uncharacterized protein LOC120539769 [Polypterus senegalus]|uniref:uncharacterized protein LOC120539769 n=1 Tax=Polypterus senegalus TaxID=55291 RepID=UPI0019655DC2|nr:uncharacterized protein LOC120539769 [Polypterus senegalus]